MHALFNLFKWSSVILSYILATLLSNKIKLHIEVSMKSSMEPESMSEMTTAHGLLQVHCVNVQLKRSRAL